MKYILGLFYSVSLLLSSCQVHPLVEGVKADTKKIFTTCKDYMISLSLEGVIEEKVICTTCDVNKYTLLLRLDHISERPDISKMQYPPYYMFKGDSLLTISVTKDFFDNVYIKDEVIKEAKDFEISVNEKKRIYMSEEKNKWLP